MRDYQTPIFTGHTKVTITYSGALRAIIYSPAGDTETKRAFVILSPGGGGVLGSMEWVATTLCNLGYICGELEVDTTASEFVQIAQCCCFDRFMHKNHKIYGVVGSKFLYFGVSNGADGLWGMNICRDILFTDLRFADSTNDLYKDAKMTLLGGASMPGDVDGNIYPSINATCVNHLDSHGDQDALLPLRSAQAAVAQMVKMGATKSRVDVYPGAGHDLSGLHDIIIAKTITFFADLMGIPPVTATT